MNIMKRSAFGKPFPPASVNQRCPRKPRQKAWKTNIRDVTWENKEMPYSLFMQERVCTSDAFCCPDLDAALIFLFGQSLVKVGRFRHPADGSVQQGRNVLVPVSGQTQVFFDLLGLGREAGHQFPDKSAFFAFDGELSVVASRTQRACLVEQLGIVSFWHSGGMVDEHVGENFRSFKSIIYLAVELFDDQSFCG